MAEIHHRLRQEVVKSRPVSAENNVIAMDRREALKKLAVGGVLAAGGSIVLSSNAVAYAQSASGPPLAETLSIVVPINGSGVGTIQLSAPPTPVGATAGATTYEWQILNCGIPSGRTLVIINTANGKIIARGRKNGCGDTPVKSPPLSNAPTVIVRTVAGGSTSPKLLEPGDWVSLKLIVKWYVGSTLIEGRYNIGGTYPSINATQG